MAITPRRSFNSRMQQSFTGSGAHAQAADSAIKVEVLAENRRALAQAMAYLKRIEEFDDAPNPPGSFAEWLAQDKSCAIVAKSGAELVGVTLVLYDSSWDDRCPHYISSVYVDAEYRRRGIARQMLEKALSQLGPKPVQLFVPADNRSAIALYESLGFRTEVKVWHAGMVGAELAVMRLDGAR
jgi:ribosomal protein S18 acetylase RimI-like enzyme